MCELYFYLFFEGVYSNDVLDVMEVEKLTSYIVDLYVFYWTIVNMSSISQREWPDKCTGTS